MGRRSSIVAATLALLAAGCASDPGALDYMQPAAMKMAVEQGQSDFNCPTATGELLSRQRMSSTMTIGAPQVQGSMTLPNRYVNRESTSTRSVYTVSVAGCARQVTYTISCPEDGAACELAGAKYAR